MPTILARTCVVALLAFVTACAAESQPTAPSVTSSPAPQGPGPALNLPPLTGPSRTFVFHGEAGYPVTNNTKQSRFVLYDNGAFVLQYPHIAGIGYRGAYQNASGTLTFTWEGWSTAGPWGATGTLVGDLLTVRYNLVMQLSDFDDAVYRLER